MCPFLFFCKNSFHLIPVRQTWRHRILCLFTSFHNPSGPSDANGRNYQCNIAKNRIKFVNEVWFLILDDSFIDSWNFKTICKNILKTKVKSKQSKVEDNAANLIQRAPISMANLMGKSEHQPAKKKVIETKTCKNNQQTSWSLHGTSFETLQRTSCSCIFFSGLFTRLQKVHLERCTCIRQLCRQFDHYSFDCSSRHPTKQPTARNLDASKK